MPDRPPIQQVAELEAAEDAAALAKQQAADAASSGGTAPTVPAVGDPRFYPVVEADRPLADKDVPQYDSASGKWRPRTPVAVGSGVGVLVGVGEPVDLTPGQLYVEQTADGRGVALWAGTED